MKDNETQVERNEQLKLEGKLQMQEMQIYLSLCSHVDMNCQVNAGVMKKK